MSLNEKKRPCFGIDLGTSNTEISMFHNGRVQTLVIPQHRTRDGLNETLSRRMPSLVYYAEDGSCRFGEVFRNPPTDLKYGVSGRVTMNTKRMLLDDPDQPVATVNIRGKEVDITPKDVAEKLLGRCLVAAEKEGYMPGDPVMITVPCAYQMDQIHATLDAARKAGFTIPHDVELITEPVAALIEYIIYQNPKIPETDPRYLDVSKPFNILVYDIGGGTLDLALVRVEKTADNSFRFTELSNNDTDLARAVGGADFDKMASDHILENVLWIEGKKRGITAEEMEERLKEARMMDNLREIVQGIAYKIKEDLAKRIHGIIPQVVLDGEITDDLDNELIRITLEGDVGYPYEIAYMPAVRKLLNQHIGNETGRNILSRIRDVLENAFYEDNTPVKLNEVSKILVTGGMTKFPPVMEALKNYLQQERHAVKSPFALEILQSEAGLEAVSRGAAYSHNLTIENRRSYRPRRYYLVVSEGLPYDLTKLSSGVINLPNPSEALLNIYSGTSPHDPNLRLQYSYHRRFSHPLQLPAYIDFRFKLEKTGEGILKGIVKDDSGRKQHIDFVEAWEDKNYIESKLHRNMTETSNSFGTGRRKQIAEGGKDGVYYGSAVRIKPMDTSEKRMFLNADNSNDAERIFEKILQIMDLEKAGRPIIMRFDDLIEVLEGYYQSGHMQVKIPVLQYALYSLRQLPLNKIKIPSCPPRPEEEANMLDDERHELSDGIYNLCAAIADLYYYGGDDVQEWMEKELRHCISEWSWGDIFQVILSIAQHVGNYEWAALLHKRLMKRSDRIRMQRVEAMPLPDRFTPNRLAQTYLNYLEDDNDPTPLFSSAVEILFRDRYGYADEHWYNCEPVRQLLSRLPSGTRDRIFMNDRRLRELIEVQDPDKAQVPEDLKQMLYNIPKEEYRKKKLWNRVNEFLDDPKSKWSMMHVLSERGKRYDPQTITRILNTPEPDDIGHQKIWIRTLACCRQKDAEAVLLRLWSRCALYPKYMMILDKGSPEKNVIQQIDGIEAFLNDTDLLERMIKDNSIDILVSLSLIRDREQLRRLSMISAFVASIPTDWRIGDRLQKGIWKRVINAVHILWGNKTNRDTDHLQQYLTIALKQLAYTASQSAVSRKRLDRALYNYCQLFTDGSSLKRLYHPQLMKHLRNLFNKCDICPLSSQTQLSFIHFLNQRYGDSDVMNRIDDYREFLLRWCLITSGVDNRNLVQSPVFRNIVGSVPNGPKQM